MENGCEYFAGILDELKRDNTDLGAGFLLKESRGDPLDSLILTILSQATNDRNSGRAFRRLKDAFPTWEDAMHASESAIEDAIREGGLAKQKAARIKSILRRINEETGSVSLDFLKDRSTNEVMEYLMSFDGVGPKTAACVALFALGRPEFPVDTHILRVSRRLGLVGEKDTAEKAQESLQKKIPPEMIMDFHLGLIEHGRRTCRPGNPTCSHCCLRRFCKKSGLKDFTLQAEKS